MHHKRKGFVSVSLYIVQIQTNKQQFCCFDRCIFRVGYFIFRYRVALPSVYSILDTIIRFMKSVEEHNSIHMVTDMGTFYYPKVLRDN